MSFSYTPKVYLSASNNNKMNKVVCDDAGSSQRTISLYSKRRDQQERDTVDQERARRSLEDMKLLKDISDFFYGRALILVVLSIIPISSCNILLNSFIKASQRPAATQAFRQPAGWSQTCSLTQLLIIITGTHPKYLLKSYQTVFRLGQTSISNRVLLILRIRKTSG